ncbi:MAG TPA: BTAD domain-containing putative transcriptional regulator [Gaiellaceae bacterium]|nr:BTAD domain-containing putative transcriptional regulator [Gaiellaceae bacterium]
MEFRILGALEVRDAGRPVSLGAQKQRAVLAVLLLRGDELVTSERLLEDVWSDGPPPTARTALQGYVSRLRKALGPDLIRTHDAGYALDLGSQERDSRRFELLLAESRSARAEGDVARAAATLAEALALWRGPALADFAYEPFAQAEIARLEGLRLAAAEERIDAELALGKGAELVGDIEALVAEHPFRERPRGLLMLALYRAGRQADALAAYQDARELLVEELGIEPGPELQRLEGSILRQEPELEARPPEPAAAAAQPPPEREVRKAVTVAALEVRTVEGAAPGLDPEAVGRVREQVTARVAAAAAKHGGVVAGSSGESTVVVFGIPTLHEDDALRALRTAVDLRDALPELGEELEGRFGIRVALRSGLDTAEVLAGGPAGTAQLLGAEIVARAAGLAAHAAPGDIVLTEATRRLVADAARLERFGPERGGGWRLVEVVPGGEAVARRLDTTFVGRTGELERLTDAFRRAGRERTTHLVSVFGVAGIGKSRLARELRSVVETEAAVLTGRCLPYGEGITFWPLRELVQEAAGDVTVESLGALLAGEDDGPLVADRLAVALGLPDAGGASEDEIFWAVRRLLGSLARERPLVVVFEDLHWAEPTFLDLVEYLADSRGHPLLLVCLARPELLEERPQWAGGKVNAASLLLDPLRPDESEALIESLLGGLVVPKATRAGIARTAEGNPLFLEQLLALVGEGIDPAADPVVPPTIEALLAARLDRLGPAEQAVVERASLVGRTFGSDALAELLPDEAQPHLAGHLESLVRKELVRPVHAPGTPAFRFGHVLIEQAAYRRIPKAERAELHEMFARWVSRTAGERIGEVEEIAGYHLERAFRYHEDLGAVDERARALAGEAARRLGASGLRARSRGDAPAAVALLGRAVALLPARDQARLELLPALGQVLREVGDLTRAREVLEEAVACGEVVVDRRIALLAELELARVRMHSDPLFQGEQAEESAGRAIAVFEELGDHAGLATAWDVAAHARFNRGQAAPAEEAWRSALAHAGEAGDRNRQTEAIVFLAFCELVGPTPVPGALERTEEFARRAEGNPVVEASVLITGGLLEAMRGGFDVARERIARGRGMLEELGQGLRAAMAPATQLGHVELLAGDPVAAEAALRPGYKGLDRMGETSFLSTLAVVLAESVYQQGRLEEAERLTEQSERAASADDVVSQVGWRVVRAKVAAARGEAEEGERLARDAVERARGTDYLDLQGTALAALAEVLERAGRAEEAAAHADEAARTFERKGNVVSAGRARELAAALSR